MLNGFDYEASKIRWIQELKDSLPTVDTPAENIRYILERLEFFSTTLLGAFIVGSIKEVPTTLGSLMQSQPFVYLEFYIGLLDANNEDIFDQSECQALWDSFKCLVSRLTRSEAKDSYALNILDLLYFSVHALKNNFEGIPFADGLDKSILEHESHRDLGERLTTVVDAETDQLSVLSNLDESIGDILAAL